MILLGSLDETTVFSNDKEKINSYINYVKENKILTESKVTVYFPVMYHDGYRFRARVKIDFLVKNSNTLKDLTYYDYIKQEGYTFNNENSFYADIEMNIKRVGNSLYIYGNSTNQVRLQE